MGQGSWPATLVPGRHCRQRPLVAWVCLLSLALDFYPGLGLPRVWERSGLVSPAWLPPQATAPSTSSEWGRRGHPLNVPGGDTPCLPLPTVSAAGEGDNLAGSEKAHIFKKRSLYICTPALIINTHRNQGPTHTASSTAGSGAWERGRGNNLGSRESGEELHILMGVGSVPWSPPEKAGP